MSLTVYWKRTVRQHNAFVFGHGHLVVTVADFDEWFAGGQVKHEQKNFSTPRLACALLRHCQRLSSRDYNITVKFMQWIVPDESQMRCVLCRSLWEKRNELR